MAVDFKAKNNPLKWKKQEFFSFVTISDGTYKMDVNSVIPIDRIRISLAGIISQDEKKSSGILVYSDIVNSFVGSLPSNFSDAAAGGVTFCDSLEAGDGMDFIFHNKVLLQGSYSIKLFRYDGTVYIDTSDTLFVLIEYFVDE